MIILSENQYSDLVSISFLDDPNLKRLSEIGGDREDAIIKVKIISKTHFCFKVHNHCGHLRIGDNVYFIIPKMGENFLRTMLQAFNKPFFSSYESSMAQNNEKSFFDELIAYLFIGAYDRSLAGNIRQGYIPERVSSYKASGRLNIEQSKMFFAYSASPPTWDRSKWSKNTKINKVLRTLFLSLSKSLDVSSKTKNLLSEIAIEFADLSYDGYINFEEILFQLDRQHESYRSVLELAILLNMQGSVSSGKSKSYSLLIPTWLLFEGACKQTIANLIPDKKINIENSFTIRVSHDSGNILDPDIVIKGHDDVIERIGDCKYTSNEECKLKRDHLFQLNTYMDGYQHFESFILYPSSSGFDKKVYQLNWGHVISVIKLSTQSYKDFENSVKKMIFEEINEVCDEKSAA